MEEERPLYELATEMMMMMGSEFRVLPFEAMNQFLHHIVFQDRAQRFACHVMQLSDGLQPAKEKKAFVKEEQENAEFNTTCIASALLVAFHFPHLFPAVEEASTAEEEEEKGRILDAAVQVAWQFLTLGATMPERLVLDFSDQLLQFQTRFRAWKVKEKSKRVSRRIFRLLDIILASVLDVWTGSIDPDLRDCFHRIECLRSKLLLHYGDLNPQVQQFDARIQEVMENRRMWLLLHEEFARFHGHVDFCIFDFY